LTADDEDEASSFPDDEREDAATAFADAEAPDEVDIENGPFEDETFEVSVDEPAETQTAVEESVTGATEPEAPSDKAAVVMDATTEVLLDSGAASVASGALQRLSAAMAPGDVLAGGNRSIETFLADLVRPELKAWLDNNLAPLVERIVEREIKKLVRDAQPE
jgi:cell pole-organizing protein PopZ